jgi:hypothetical protein
MNSAASEKQLYRQQITAIAQHLAAARPSHIRDSVHPGDSLDSIKMFTDGNCEKRLEKLQNQLEILAAVFEDLDDLVAAFIKSHPLSAYDTGCTDADRFLIWLQRRAPLSLVQLDYVACQQARQMVESIGRKNRLGHIRFQEQWSITGRLVDQLETNPDLQIHLNPLRTWTTFHTSALLDDTDSPPIEVLFFACRSDIRTAALNAEAVTHIRALEEISPCHLTEWMSVLDFTQTQDFVPICRECAEMGLIAFG